MTVPFAFFDTCSRHPDPGNTHFVIADKMAVVHRKIQWILTVADRTRAPVLSTTCLGIQRTHPGMSVQAACAAQRAAVVPPDVALITSEATPREVQEALSCRYICIQRPCCNSPDQAVATRSFDPFQANAHTARIVRNLGPRHWLVFGAGFEYCLLAAVEGLRALHTPVSVLKDACIPSARSTPETFRSTLERFAALDVAFVDSDRVLCGAANP